MPQQFITQLEQVCRRRKWHRWLATTCWALAVVIVVTFALAGLDYALNINDWMGRLLLTTLLASCLGGIYACWRGALSEHPVTPLQIAHEVEQHHPRSSNVLSSAWDFSQQAGDDPTAGSESLRRAVVLRADAATADIDWNQLVSRKPLHRAALSLAGAAFLVILLGWWQPQMIRIGLARITSPSWAIEWPREHDLQFVEPPTMLAAGEDLVLQLRDTRGSLPSAITMHYRTRRQGRWFEETQSLATTNPFEIRRPNVQESLQFRATGSDHQTMTWHSLEVVTPPRVESLQIIVTPPRYTELAERAWDSNKPIYAGSHLQLQGRTDQSVTRVVLFGAGGIQVETQISPDRQTFRIESSAWQMMKSDTLRLQLTTTAGLTVSSDDELSIEVVPDQTPKVRFVEPTSDLSVLPTAVVPMVIEVSDDVAIRQIELVYLRSDRLQEGVHRTLLWPNDSKEMAGDSVVQQKRVHFRWQLEPLSIEPGSVIEINAQATDALPATGQTVRPLRLKIVSEDELWRMIIERQSLLVETIAASLREQRELSSITADWAGTPDWSKTRWASASLSALFRQRQVTDAFVADQHGVLSQLVDLIQTIERNGLFRPQANDRLQIVHGLLQNLVDSPLAEAELSLSELARQSQRSPDRKKMQPLIAKTGERQEQVVAGLRRAIDLLMPGNVLGQLERELATLERDQETLEERCREEIAPLLFQSRGNQKAQQTAFASAVRRQRDLARRLAELMLNMAQAAQRLTDQEPLLGARLGETVTLAEQLETQATIQSAADQLMRQRLGRSMNLQQQVLRDLARLRVCLAGQDSPGAVERFKRLQAVERELQRLRRQVALHEQKIRQLRPEPSQRELNRLRRHRGKLAEQADAISRKLERLRIARAAKPASDAVSLLRRATLDIESTMQARQQLDVAQRQLTAARRRQQVALARLEMAKLDAKLSALVDRQKSVKREIVRLDDLGHETGGLTHAQEQSVMQWVDRQADLREEVIIQADQLTSLPVFAYLLKKSSETMQSVEEYLQQIELGLPTQALAELAVNQLTQLAEALQQKRQNLSAKSRDTGRGGERQLGDTPQEQTLQLALGQLQLLKSLQSVLRERTKTMEQQRTVDQPLADLTKVLAREQQQLTELARQLIPEPPDPPATELFPFEQLGEDLGDDLGKRQPAKDDWLSKVVKQMQTAQSLLERSDNVGSGGSVGSASSAQAEALTGLDAMIAELTERQSQCKGGGKCIDGESKNPDSPKPGNKPGSSEKSGKSPANSASSSTNNNANLSTELAVAGELVKDLWGHLPERQREQILQPLSEEFLPQYASEIEAYFRALAAPPHPRPEFP